MGVVSKSGLAGAVQAGRLELLPGRQVDDDGDEIFHHGVFSELVSCLWGSGCSVPGKGLGNGQGCRGRRDGSECCGGSGKGGGGFFFPVDQHVGLLVHALVE